MQPDSSQNQDDEIEPSQNQQIHHHQQEQKFGRTWADLFSGGGFFLLCFTAIIGLVFLIYTYGNLIPMWGFVSVGLSLIWWPFLAARAREDTSLMMVIDSASSLTEYRVGSRYPVEIEGGGVWFGSRTGVSRMLLTELDLENKWGVGSPLAGFTPFDYIRDMTTLQRLSKAFTDHLQGERVTNELVGLEVERKVQEYSQTWLEMLYGDLDPTELKDIIARTSQNQEIYESEEVDLTQAVGDDIESSSA